MRGLGTDIIEIARIQQSLQEFGDRFLERHFTPKEISYCTSFSEPAARLAGRFAAKEAITKALGTGFNGIGFLDIEILNAPSGAPEAKIHLSDYKHLKILLSISHCRLFATATAIIL